MTISPEQQQQRAEWRKVCGLIVAGGRVGSAPCSAWQLKELLDALTAVEAERDQLVRLYRDAIPFVTTDEDGELAYCLGHVDPQRFVRAIRANAVMDGWTDQLDGLVLDPQQVGHTWRYDEGPDTEQMPECDPDHDGATAFTELALTEFRGTGEDE